MRHIRVAKASHPISFYTMIQLRMLDTSRIRAVLFDLDGTLYDQSILRRKMAARLLRACAANPRRGFRALRAVQAYRHAHEALRNGEYTAERHLELACGACGYAAGEVQAIVAEWIERQPLDLLPLCVYPQLHEFLGTLSQLRLALGVFSDYPTEQKIEALGFKSYFRHQLSAGAVGRLKPDPLGILALAEAVAIPPSECLYIGDRTIDQDAAHSAGMQFALVDGRNTYAQLLGQFRNGT
jgi:putative hydrolase of the HAD superfamily